MSAIEDRVKNIDDRVKSLESKFTFAVTLALFLGVSVAGLGAWVKSEAGKISDLDDRVKKLDPFVKDAEAQLAKAGTEQIVLIQQKAGPIVNELTKQAFDKMVTNSSASSSAAADNPFSHKEMGSPSTASCPAGEYLAGVTIHWAGTCHGACDEDGGAVHSVVASCRKLIP